MLEYVAWAAEDDEAGPDADYEAGEVAVALDDAFVVVAVVSDDEASMRVVGGSRTGALVLGTALVGEPTILPQNPNNGVTRGKYVGCAALPLA